MLVFVAYAATLCCSCNKIGMCNTYFLIWICNARKIKKIMANEDKETAAPTTTLTTKKKQQNVWIARIFCVEVQSTILRWFIYYSFDITSLILFWSQDQHFLLVCFFPFCSFVCVCECVCVVWVCHHENERCHWSATGIEVSFQFFDGRETSNHSMSFHEVPCYRYSYYSRHNEANSFSVVQSLPRFISSDASALCCSV